LTLTDEQLAAKAAAGDRAAMEELATRFHTPLTRYYRKLTRHPEDAKDMTQAALIHMIEKIHKYRAGQGHKFSSWLFKLAYNLFIDEVRRKKPPPIEAEALQRIPYGKDEHACVDSRDQITGLLATLSDELRSIVVLRYYVDMGYDEIGRVMGCSSKRVKWRLHDAMEKLRKEANA
jgi:RNA polymerase sigma-70 factor (ECF subfamily)